MIEVLHSYLSGQIRKESYAVVGTILRISVAQGRHTVGEIYQAVDTLNAATGGSNSRRLTYSIDSHLLFTSVNIAKTAGNRFK